MKSESTVEGSRESETSAFIVAVLGMSLNVQDWKDLRKHGVLKRLGNGVGRNLLVRFGIE